MRTIAAATWVAALGLVWPGAAFAEGKGRKSAPCVGFSQEDSDGGRTITFRIANSCQADLRCAIVWQVTCKTDDGQSTVTHDEVSSVPSGAERSFVASAASCGEDAEWVISAPKWQCKAPSSNVARKAR